MNDLTLERQKLLRCLLILLVQKMEIDDERTCLICGSSISELAIVLSTKSLRNLFICDSIILESAGSSFNNPAVMQGLGDILKKSVFYVEKMKDIKTAFFKNYFLNKKTENFVEKKIFPTKKSQKIFPGFIRPLKQQMRRKNG